MARKSPIRFRVVVTENGMMLSKLIARRLGRVSAREARDLVQAGGVYMGELRVRVPSVRVVTGERITVYPEAATIQTMDAASLRFVHRDPAFVVLDKPAGVPVTATRESARGTLADALLRQLEAEGVTRPYVGVVHRLDRAASGLVLMTIRGAANRNVHRQFEQHTMRRIYRVRVVGAAPESISCELALVEARKGSMRVARSGEPRARPATTHFRRIAQLDDESLLEVELETGRTHQIRVHARELGFPVRGDPRYGTGEVDASERMYLHAWRMELDHPLTGQPIEVQSELPEWARAPSAD